MLRIPLLLPALLSAALFLACAAEGDPLAEDCSSGRCDEAPSCTTSGIEDLGAFYDSEELSSQSSFSQVPGWQDLWSFDVVDEADGENPRVRIEVTGSTTAMLALESMSARIQCNGAEVVCTTGSQSSVGVGCQEVRAPGPFRGVLEFEVDCDGIDDSASVNVSVQSAREDRRGEDLPNTCEPYELDVLVY